jgi:hypothetical protein
MSFMVEKDDDDDFSPEDAFNMFTPSLYRPGFKDRSDVIAPPGLDAFTQDVASVTLSALGGGPSGGGAHQPPGGYGWKLGENLTKVVLPTPSTVDEGLFDNWILGEWEDAILLPVVLSVIGLCAIIGNALLLFTMAGLRRMRSGPNLMLANVALADIVFVAVTVPTAVVNHATKSRRSVYGDDEVIGPRVCRFVYYVIFVTVYVTVYTLVVSSVFRFFGELMRGSGRILGGNAKITAMTRGSSKSPIDGCGQSGIVATAASAGGGGSGGVSHPVPLSPCSAAVSCAVVWVAFAASHLTFVVQTDITGLAAFEKPVICVYSPPGGSPGAAGDSGSGADQSRVRTLWITFLACAFLLPLTIVCCTSAAVLRMQRRAVHGKRRLHMDDDDPCRQLGPASDVSGIGCSAVEESTILQNMNNDGRAKREMTTIIMVAAVARAICWLPLQIFVLIDVFGPEPEPEATADVYRKAEMFGVCMALVGACVGPPIYRLSSREFRDAFRLVIRRICCCKRGPASRPVRDPATYVSSRMIVREPSLVVQTVDYQRHLHRQSPISSMSSSSCYSHERPPLPVHHHRPPPPAQQPQQLSQQQQQVVHKHQLLSRQDVQQLVPGRASTSDVNETILSIISDSSNHINYA